MQSNSIPHSGGGNHEDAKARRFSDMTVGRPPPATFLNGVGAFVPWWLHFSLLLRRFGRDLPESHVEQRGREDGLESNRFGRGDQEVPLEDLLALFVFA